MASNQPATLYQLCLRVSVREFESIEIDGRSEYDLLPDHVLFDFYYQMYTDKRLCLLSMALSNSKSFMRMLRVKHKRRQLFSCVQTLLDHGSSVLEELDTAYRTRNKTVASDGQATAAAVDEGLRFGAFLCEGGWYTHAANVLDTVEKLCLKQGANVQYLRRLLDCYHRRIYVESTYRMFKEAENTFNLANKTVEQLNALGAFPNLAGLYANFSNLFGMRSEYEEAYQWAQKAIGLLTDELPTRVIIDVLRQASRSCVFKRRFLQAGLLIEQAVLLAEQLYKVDEHPSYCDTITDYGFYLLNYDNIEESACMFRKALRIRSEIFGKNNMHVAIGYEDLAYAVYVHEYSSGKFFDARNYADLALQIMEKILPKDHLALASTKRVKALILEEIAVDMRDPWTKSAQQHYLHRSEQLHKSALELSLAAFGEQNVQTAKHYGNLGRLYQSMNLYEEAEKMHRQAIAIKEELLGTDDYEVGLSLGHLASLYNFHMHRYRDAEQLYLRLKLFGASYSGLEYDYRGLINVYTELQDISELLYFNSVMRDWQKRRLNMPKPKIPTNPTPLSAVVAKFNFLC